MRYSRSDASEAFCTASCGTRRVGNSSYTARQQERRSAPESPTLTKQQVAARKAVCCVPRIGPEGNVCHICIFLLIWRKGEGGDVGEMGGKYIPADLRCEPDTMVSNSSSEDVGGMDRTDATGLNRLEQAPKRDTLIRVLPSTLIPGRKVGRRRKRSRGMRPDTCRPTPLPAANGLLWLHTNLRSVVGDG